MRRRIEGRCATLTISEGDRIGVFRALLDDADVEKVLAATPDAIDVKGMRPDMPVCGVELKTATRDVRLTIPLAPPHAETSALTNLLNEIDQRLLRHPHQTVRGVLSIASSVARVTLLDDGAVPVDLRIESIQVLAAREGDASSLAQIGATGSTTLHLDACGAASIDVPITLAHAGRHVAVARVSLSFDVDATNAVAPDGTASIRAVLSTHDLAVDVSP